MLEKFQSSDKLTFGFIVFESAVRFVGRRFRVAQIAGCVCMLLFRNKLITLKVGQRWYRHKPEYQH